MYSFWVRFSFFALLLGSHLSFCGWNPFTKEAWEEVGNHIANAGKKAAEWSLSQLEKGGEYLGEGIKYAKQGITWFAKVTTLDVAFNFLLDLAKEGYNHAKPALDPVYNAVIKPTYKATIAYAINAIVDAISKGKIDEAVKFLNETADLIGTIPTEIKGKITELTTMPTQLNSGIQDVDKVIAQIVIAQADVQKQRAELIAQNLKGKGLEELNKLHDKLMEAFTSLEQALSLLVGCEPNKVCLLDQPSLENLKKSLDTNAFDALMQSALSRCKFGILCEFRGSLAQAFSQAQSGIQLVTNNLSQLDSTINSPSLGYPGLPARLRAVASLLKP